SDKDIEDDYGIDYPDSQPEYADFYWRNGFELNISGFDYIVELNHYSGSAEILRGGDVSFEANGKQYKVKTTNAADEAVFIELQDESGETVQVIELTEAYQEILDRSAQTGGSLTLEEATIDQENEQAKLRMIFNSVRYSQGQYSRSEERRVGKERRYR